MAVDETVMKVEERQVESADMDAFDDLFGIDRCVCRTALISRN